MDLLKLIQTAALIAFLGAPALAANEKVCNSINLGQSLASQTALTVWLNADQIALDVLWQRYVDSLILCSKLQREEAIRNGNSWVEYGAVHAKDLLRSRGRPVESLLLDGSAFYAMWEKEHGLDFVW